jgi:cytoskeletal protein RodZ
LDDVSRVTRIGKNYLSAIENNSFDKLPNPAYVKGFLRVYARYLGIDADKVVSRYESERGGATASPVASSQKKEPVAPPRPSMRPVRWFLPLGLITLIVIAALLSGRQKNSQERLPAVPVVAITSNAVPSDAKQTPISSAKAVKVEPVGTVTTVAAASEPVVTGLVLRLKINQDSWLHLTIDDSTSQQYDLKAGDIIEWKADRVIVLDVGNAGGIEGELNGKPLKPLGGPGKTAHLVLKADQT